MLLETLKRTFFFQNAASWAHALVPAAVSHNLDKYGALKKAMYLTALERLDGDYLEFGVFTGSSFVFALRMHRRLTHLGKLSTRFFGFDSFSGFGKKTEADDHPFYVDDFFSVNSEKVIANIRRHASGSEVKIVKGYFEETVAGKSPSDLGISKARVVFIDCDLREPALIALNFVRPALQQGTMLVMDDFFSYRGDETKGLAGAFKTFCAENPSLGWRRVCDYGMGGVVYVLSRAETVP